jgi:16S rRNA processing protein RimM
MKNVRNNVSMKDLIIVGKVLKPRGLTGEVQVYLSSPSVVGEFFESAGGKKVFIAGKEFIVKKYAFVGEFAYLTFDGVRSVEVAEGLRGQEVRIPREAVRIGDDEVLADDLIGFSVVGLMGQVLGAVKRVVSYGHGEVVECLGEVGEFSFPYEDVFVVETNILARKIVVREEMLEESTDL